MNEILINVMSTVENLVKEQTKKFFGYQEAKLNYWMFGKSDLES